MKVKGIYKIENIENNKVYIGESIDIERRWQEHIDSLNNNSHHSWKLQADWNKYGKDSFTFEIIEQLHEEANNFKSKYYLIYREDCFIKQYDSLDNGYNCENTLLKIANGDKQITKKHEKDIHILKVLINNPEDFSLIVVEEKVKKGRKPRKRKRDKIKKENINTNENITLHNLYKQLKDEGYDIRFKVGDLYTILEHKGILYFENHSYYISEEYIKEGYLKNGKSVINKYGFIRYEINCTEKSKLLLIEKLYLTHKQNNKNILK